MRFKTLLELQTAIRLPWGQVSGLWDGLGFGGLAVALDLHPSQLEANYITALAGWWLRRLVLS